MYVRDTLTEDYKNISQTVHLSAYPSGVGRDIRGGEKMGGKGIAGNKVKK